MAEIEVDTTGGKPCHRCGELLLLVARVPHALTLPDGSPIAGTRSVGVCQVCDRDDPARQGVLAFFAFHGRITRPTVREAGALISEWLGHEVAHPPAYSDADLDEDIRAWEAGEI
ncbi:MAG: DUF6300 family protein [Pseudonocardia sp.]